MLLGAIAFILSFIHTFAYIAHVRILEFLVLRGCRPDPPRLTSTLSGKGSTTFAKSLREFSSHDPRSGRCQLTLRSRP